MALNNFSGVGPAALPPSPYINMPYFPMPRPYPYPPPFQYPGYPMPPYQQYPPYGYSPYRPVPIMPPPLMQPPIFVAPGLPFTGWWIPRDYFSTGDLSGGSGATDSQGFGFGQGSFIA